MLLSDKLIRASQSCGGFHLTRGSLTDATSARPLFPHDDPHADIAGGEACREADRTRLSAVPQIIQAVDRLQRFGDPGVSEEE